MPNFRMSHWALLTVALLMAVLFFREAAPDSLVAVTLYKAHLMALAGWGGYWLDRALFPYDRPHEYLQLDQAPSVTAGQVAETEMVAGNAFGLAMLRRAIIVAACLICVALGA